MADERPTKRYKSEMTVQEIEDAEEESLLTGPMSLLTDACKHHDQILVAMRHGKKLVGRVKAFDRHFNMILENVKEIWTEGQGDNKKPKDRFLSKLFVRGDGVILIVKAE
ncbi:hypothetical protein MP228_012669 [Amoeboaphelidium protococcarum]|nr:hypothetical protein MP228_012669 [Amoeboaphelidium protococcarum]